MTKRLLILFALFSVVIAVPSAVIAQGMSGNKIRLSSWQVTNDHTAGEETEGKEIWDALQAKQIECKNLSDDKYGMLGEYFMGLSVGNTEKHTAMNRMMTNMMGEQGEEQMHIALGKRSSGCDTNASLPSGYSILPMMWMMGGGGNSMMGYGGWNNLMAGWGGFGLGWIVMIIFWASVILGVVALVRYVGGQHNADAGKTSLDILKERYARGEIGKKEFDEMKKDVR